MTIAWDPDFALRSPMFVPLRALAQTLPRAEWPDCTVLNELVAAQVPPLVNATGLPLVFVPQSARQTQFEDKYEPRIFLRGEVQVRSENWHDLFNALVWLAFPRAKAQLNRRHYEASREALREHRATGLPNRGPQQDALTLFDEGGVIVASSAPAMTELLRGHHWKPLFWQGRSELAGAMAFHLFGHALYEKALAPFTGIAGRGVIIEVDGAFFAHALAQQLAELDARLAEILQDPQCFRTTHELAAVPILGVPGWCADNARETYYDDTAYFRPRRINYSTDRR